MVNVLEHSVLKPLSSKKVDQALDPIPLPQRQWATHQRHHYLKDFRSSTHAHHYLKDSGPPTSDIITSRTSGPPHMHTITSKTVDHPPATSLPQGLQVLHTCTPLPQRQWTTHQRHHYLKDFRSSTHAHPLPQRQWTTHQ